MHRIGRSALAIVTWALAAATPAVGADSGAAGYPAKPVRILTSPVGAFGDIVTRQIAQRLHERWEQPVVVENRARSMIGAGVTAKSAPDGYTLLVGDRTWHAVAQSLYKELPYDPRSRLLGRNVRPGANAIEPDRQTEPRCRRHFAIARDAIAVARAGRGAPSQHAGGIRRLHQERDREVGPGHQDRRHQAGVTHPPIVN